MDTINELSNMVLVLIRAGAVFRVGYIFFQMIGNEDEVQAGKRRIKNTLAFYIIAEMVFVLKNVITSYY